MGFPYVGCFTCEALASPMQSGHVEELYSRCRRCRRLCFDRWVHNCARVFALIERRATRIEEWKMYMSEKRDQYTVVKREHDHMLRII